LGSLKIILQFFGVKTSVIAGAKLTWESIVDVWVMTPEDSLCVVNDQPVGNPKRKV
jgi:hypothetical protein